MARKDLDCYREITIDSLMILVCANQKGGVGKTTTATHIAEGLTLIGKRAVLLDLDPQKNALLSLTQELIENCPNQNTQKRGQRSPERDFDLFQAKSGTILACPKSFPEQKKIENLLQLSSFLIVDCPPTLMEWTPLAIQNATDILIPLQCEFLSLNGLTKILTTIKHLVSTKTVTVSILPMMYEPKNPIQKEILEDVAENLPEIKTFTKIPKDRNFGEATSYGKSLFSFKPTSIGCRAYADLIRELSHGW